MPLCRAFCGAAFSVCGFDIDPGKVKALSAGRSYLKHIPNAVVRQMLAGGRLSVTTDFSRLARMDATRLALQDATFDVALMLDFVEHVHQPDLGAAMREVARALKPGGRLIIHTSPNRLFEEFVYRHYVRNVHRAVLGLVRLLRLDKGRLLNALLLPTDPLPPHDEYERQLHINPQSAGSLPAWSHVRIRVPWPGQPDKLLFEADCLAHRIQMIDRRPAYLIGLQFDELTDEQQQSLQEFMGLMDEAAD